MRTMRIASEQPRFITRFSSLAVVCFALVSSACDDGKPASPAPSASPPAASVAKVETPLASAAPSAAPPAHVVKRKDPASCPKDGPVVFEDATLEAAVRRQLQKPSGPIARAELKKVKTLEISQAPNNDQLDPCVFMYLTGLKGLYLAPGDLDDLSPIKGATSLNSLRVSATKVSDLSPLAGMHALDRLDVGRTPVRDLSPLASLTSLTELQLDDTEISDITPLAKLEKLEVLLLKRTRVSDITPLRGLRKLKHLYIEGSLIQDTSPVVGIPGLKVH
jgi:internalin A